MSHHHSDVNLPLLVITGEHEGENYLVIVQGKPARLAEVPFTALLKMLHKVATTLTHYAKIGNSPATAKNIASRVRTGLGGLIKIKPGRRKSGEYRLIIDPAQVCLDPSVQEIPEDLLPRNWLEVMQPKFAMLPDSVVAQYREDRSATTVRPLRDHSTTEVIQN